MAHPTTCEAAVHEECPRCGYDLSGLIASWRSECPLEGCCSECGLAFRWQDYFDGQLAGPVGSFEHARRRAWRAILPTMWLAARPRGPWREPRAIRIEHTIRHNRLLQILVLAYALLHLSMILVAVGGMLISDPFWWNEVSWIIERPGEALRTAAWPYSTDGSGNIGGLLEISFIWLLGTWFFMPLLMLILGESFRRVRVRRIHLLRGVAYSMPAALAMYLLFTLFLHAFFYTLDLRSRPPSGPEELVVLAAWLASGPVWMGRWWYSFIKRYLRLPHAGAVACTLMFVAMLATFTFSIVLAPYLGF